MKSKKAGSPTSTGSSTARRRAVSPPLRDLGSAPPVGDPRQSGVILAQSATANGRLRDVFTLSSITKETTLAGAAIAYLAHLDGRATIGRTSPNTVLARRYGLRFLGDLAKIRLCDLRRSAIITWADDLALTAGVVRRVPASLEFSALRSLQAMLMWCANQDACMPGLASRIPTGYLPQPGRALSRLELDLMRAALEANDRPHRIAATRLGVQILRVLAEDGSRTNEVRCARRENFDHHNGVLRWARGKNGKPRIIVLSPTSQALLKMRAALVPAGAALFVNPTTSLPVTHHAVNRILKRIAEEAGLERPHDLSPHDFRHTFATLAFEGGAALEDVSAALSHSSTATTKNTYLHNIVSPGARRAHAIVNGRAA